ncbi:SAM-dependent methyltransferase [Leucobacter tardus]|uniref:SAM-dependent methyltransferase n=1 Tax=Leucobacter tardus TaxID=501483 RepID=A0A939TMM1_9MICO|nr:class I SAM-dependent methyltransferase [Leucobacter tardus]MBO2989608.1 SAM-dependent methyltransferase [Leucobacter tardus]
MGAPDPPPGWDALFTPEGRTHLADAERAIADGASSAQAGAALRRAGVASDAVAAILTQAELRRRAVTKFGDAAGALLFTQAGLEQASRHVVAETHAARFRASGCRRVADLGAGIGAESLALVAAGVGVTAVEIDPFTARFTEHNVSVAVASVCGHDSETTSDVRIADATTLDLAGIDGAFLDPARRTAGSRDTRRLASVDDYTPSLDFAFALGERMPTGVKLGPGFDRELIPANAEAQWVSVDGDVVEMGLWFGAVARPGVRRAALILRGGRRHELTEAADAADPESAELGEYLYEPDGAVIRARLIGLLAERLDAGTISPGIAYLASDRLVRTPFAQTFRIVEELPMREKDLRRALAERDIGRLEIKKRGADVDPAGLRTRLNRRGDRRATLVLTRVGGRHTALLAERVPAADPSV